MSICEDKTTYIYTIVDRYGFVGGFIDKSKLNLFLNKFKNNAKLITISFPLDEKSQKDYIYFLPYKVKDDCDMNPLALVTNNRNIFLSTQKCLLDMDITYPDDIKCFTRKINSVSDFEAERVLDDTVQNYKQMFDTLLTRISDEEKEYLERKLDDLKAGVIHTDISDVLNPKSGLICNLKDNQVSNTQLPENAELPNSVKSSNSDLSSDPDVES